MRLSDILSKEQDGLFSQVDNFIGNRRPTIGQPRKIETGKIALNFYCKNCEADRTFVSKKELSFVSLSESMASIDAGLTCTACDRNTLPIWFLIDVDGDISLPAPKVRVLNRMIKYTEKTAPSKDVYGEYSSLLEKAELAYQVRLGAGALVYLRKLYETITLDTAHAVRMTDDKLHKPNGKMKPFKEILTAVDETAHIIPEEFAEDGYKLFGELSDVVHGTYDEEDGLRKYSSLRRLVVGILEKINNNRELTEAMRSLGWTDSPSDDR